MKNNEFVPIPDYNGCYAINKMGIVKSVERKVKHYMGGHRLVREKYMKTHQHECGYNTLSLNKNGERNTFSIHQLMAMTFLNHKVDGHNIVVDHINNDKSDNRIENLQLITTRENSSKNRSKTYTKYTGVYLRGGKKKWTASIKIDGYIKYLGGFLTEIEAHNAYTKAKNSIV